MNDDEEMLDDPPHKRKSIRDMTLSDIALFVVVLIVAFSAFQSQRATNKVNDTQDTIAKIGFCNQEYLSKTIIALNARTENSAEQSRANVELQKAQATFLGLLLTKPAPTTEQAQEAFRKYFSSLTEFIATSGTTTNNVDNNPFPTNGELTACLNRRNND